MAKQLIISPTVRHFYPWPIVLVSCVDDQGKPNIITIGASSVCSSGPPTVGIAVGIRQYSRELIRSTGDFGANLPSTDQLHQTDYCGIHSGRNMNKYEAAGLTPMPSTQITSPLIQECPVSFECKLVHEVNLGSHDWLIGEIVAVHVDDAVLDEAGDLDPSKTDPIMSFWGEYWGLGERLEKWHFARE